MNGALHWAWGCLLDFFFQVEAKIVIKYCAARKNIEGSVIGVLFSIC